MVLSKRNANGEFEAWIGSSQGTSSKLSQNGSDAPPAKKPRLSTFSNLEEPLKPAYANSGTVLNEQSNPFMSVSAGKATKQHPSTSPGHAEWAWTRSYMVPPTSSMSMLTGKAMIAGDNSRLGVSNVPSTNLEIHPFHDKVSGGHISGIQPPRHEGSSSLTGQSTALSKSISVPTSITQPASFTSKVQLPLSSQPASSQPSSSSQPNISAKAPRGRKRTANGEPAPKPEKRGAVFKKKCPQNILDRVERVRTQRIFMIDRNRVDGELKEEFSVLGSTGNVYTVTIDHRPRCNCPDALKGNHCKHILFIFLKVLQVTQASGYWYQKALITSELEDIFAHAPLAPNSLAHPHICEAFARATGKAVAPAAAGAINKRMPGPDDDCPICYDGMHGVAEASLVFCQDCGNALHKECFGQWQLTAANTGKDLTCVWCRAPWVLPLGGAGGGRVGVRRGEEGYLNMTGVGDVSPERDTSTYYHGPRRGQRYRGYQAYYG